jgi:PIN like domain
VRFFFDNNISPKIAHALNCLVQAQLEVVHLRDRFAPATSYADWMTKLANEMVGDSFQIPVRGAIEGL